MSDEPSGETIAGIALGILAAVAVLIVGVGLAGAGHGWGTPLAVSLTAFVLFPAAGVLVLSEPSPPKQQWSLVVLGSIFAMDVLLYALTTQEGLQYFDRVALSLLPLLLAWLVIWGGANIIAALAVARQYGAGFTIRNLMIAMAFFGVLMVVAIKINGRIQNPPGQFEPQGYPE